MDTDNWLIQVGNDAIKGYLQNDPDRDMSEVKHTIIHKVEPPQNILPAIQQSPQLPIIQQVPPQQIIQQIPARSYIQNMMPPENNSSGFRMNKGDWMDMMMMQNHQMHQLVVQQMMMQSLPGCRPNHPPVTYMTEPAPVVVSERPSGAVHHHHYQMQPPSQPPVHHYTSLPPLEPRMISPMRARSTLPGYYYYNDDGSNYYVYH